MRIQASASLLAGLRHAAAATYPDEGCGVVVGKPERDVVVLHALVAGRNLRTDRARDRYELDPAAIVRADREARAHGLDVVGFWHSHPDHPARPSAFDTERAWPQYAYLIVATTAWGGKDVRAWVLEEEGGAFAEADIEEVAGAAMPPDTAPTTREAV